MTDKASWIAETNKLWTDPNNPHGVPYYPTNAIDGAKGGSVWTQFMTNFWDTSSNQFLKVDLGRAVRVVEVRVWRYTGVAWTSKAGAHLSAYVTKSPVEAEWGLPGGFVQCGAALPGAMPGSYHRFRCPPDGSAAGAGAAEGRCLVLSRGIHGLAIDEVDIWEYVEGGGSLNSKPPPSIS